MSGADATREDAIRKVVFATIDAFLDSSPDAAAEALTNSNYAFDANGVLLLRLHFSDLSCTVSIRFDGDAA